VNLTYPGDATKLYPRITSGNGNNVTTYGLCPSAPTCYTYNVSTHTVTWTGSQTTVKVSWDYTIPGVPGIAGGYGQCGPYHPNASNAFCLETTYKAALITGGDPGSGPNTGAIAVRLLK